MVNAGAVLLDVPDWQLQLVQDPEVRVDVHVTCSTPIESPPLIRSPLANWLTCQVSVAWAPLILTVSWTLELAAITAADVGLASGKEMLDGVIVSVSVGAARRGAAIARAAATTAAICDIRAHACT